MTDGSAAKRRLSRIAADTADVSGFWPVGASPLANIRCTSSGWKRVAPHHGRKRSSTPAVLHQGHRAHSAEQIPHPTRTTGRDISCLNF